MPEVNKNIPENGQQVVSPFNHTNNNQPYQYIGTYFLEDLGKDDILRDIARRIKHGRRLIIPIGLPQSGKSMFIASLLAYVKGRAGDNSCNFTCLANRQIDNILDALNDNRVLPATTENAITFIDLDMKSNYRDEVAKVTLVDLAGEDIRNMINGVQNDAVGKIKNILRACVAQKAIFALLTPVYDGQGQSDDFDNEEDNKMKTFIDWLKINEPNLYNLTQILLVVTKWDKVTGKPSTKGFLKRQRNQLYNEYHSYDNSYGLLPFSVGTVVGETIMKIDLRSPKNFWHTLYHWCTGKKVLPWWKRIL